MFSQGVTNLRPHCVAMLMHAICRSQLIYYFFGHSVNIKSLASFLPLSWTLHIAAIMDLCAAEVPSDIYAQAPYLSPLCNR